MSYERCKSCLFHTTQSIELNIVKDNKFILKDLDQCVVGNLFVKRCVPDNVKCLNYKRRNENMTQNKMKEKSQAELLAEAMHQQTMDVVNGYLGHDDMVNHPPHYADSCSIECIESMEIAFGIKYTAVYCLINAYKYLWRRKAKNGLQDVKKALWYLDRYYSYIDMLSFTMPSDEYDMYNEKARTMYDMATKVKGEGECKNEKQN